MNKTIFLLLIICLFTTSLPRYGVLCQDTPVYGSPYEGMKVRYTLPEGEVVRLREQSHGTDRSWVMIKPANWIRISVLCDW